MLAVLRLVYGNFFQGVTKTSVRVFWWSKYSHYGVSNLAEHQTMLNLLLKLRDNDVRGPGSDPYRCSANKSSPRQLCNRSCYGNESKTFGGKVLQLFLAAVL
jgi:hypothetical protein